MSCFAMTAEHCQRRQWVILLTRSCTDPIAELAKDRPDTMNNTVISLCLTLPVNARNCQIQKTPLTIS